MKGAAKDSLRFPLYRIFELTDILSHVYSYQHHLTSIVAVMRRMMPESSAGKCVFISRIQNRTRANRGCLSVTFSVEKVPFGENFIQVFFLMLLLVRIAAPTICHRLIMFAACYKV